MKSAVVLVSGRGSNLRAIAEAATGIEIRAVVSNRPDAGALDYARSRGLATEVVDHRAFASTNRARASCWGAVALAS